MDRISPPRPLPSVLARPARSEGRELYCGADLHLAEAKVLMRWGFWERMGLALVMSDSNS